MPLYIMCMRPNSFDTKLVANRDEEYSKIKGKIGMFLDNRDEERRKLMIYGERGVGKSILIIKILKDISEEKDLITISIDGDEARNPEDLLRDICKNLAEELYNFYTKNENKNDVIDKEIAFLDYISYAKTLKDTDVITIVERLEGNIESSIGIFNILALRSKIGAVEGKDHTTSHEIEQSIDSKFIIKLLENVTEKVHDFADILIYIDNLDQLEDKDSIDDFVTEIIKLKKPILVTSMRREVADRNIGRDFKEVQYIEPMTSDGLILVFKKRLEIGCSKKDELLNTQLLDIAEILKDCTGNPLSFLTWLNYLIVDADLDSSKIVKNLRGFTKAYYSTFDEKKIEEIAKYFISAGSEFLHKEKIISELGIENDLLDMLDDFGVIIPENRYNPRSYKVSSDFMFYQLDS